MMALWTYSIIHLVSLFTDEDQFIVVFHQHHAGLDAVIPNSLIHLEDDRFVGLEGSHCVQFSTLDLIQVS